MKANSTSGKTVTVKVGADTSGAYQAQAAVNSVQGKTVYVTTIARTMSKPIAAATGGPTATYHLSVSVHPATEEVLNCTTYSSTDVPKTIGPGTGLSSSILTVPGNPRIADVDVTIELNHALMQDVDAVLHSPAGTAVQLFSDIASNQQ